jgi:hypothetical protein
LKSSSSVLTMGPPAYETSFVAYETSLPTALTLPAAGQRGPSWNMRHCCAAVFLDSPLTLPPSLPVFLDPPASFLVPHTLKSSSSVLTLGPPLPGQAPWAISLSFT